MKKTKSAADVAHEGVAVFDRRLKELARYIPVTGSVLAVNVTLWIIMLTRGVDWLDPSGDSLLAWGANYGPLTTHGEGWRLLSACFLHAGIVQLLVNQWALWQYGRWLERLLGHLGFALLFFLAAVVSSLAALHWHPETVLVGSTGAIAGLIGALAAFAWRVRGVIPALAIGRMRASTFVFLAYNVGVEMYRQRLDAAGFLSGLAAGFVAGLILSQPLGDQGRPRRLNRVSLLAALGLVVVLMAAFFARPDPSVEFAEIREAQGRVIATYRSALDDYRHDRVDTKQFIEALGNDVLKLWRRTEVRLQELDRRRLPGKAGDYIKRLYQATQLREQGLNLAIDSLLEDSEEGMRAAAEKIADADRIEAALDAELKADEEAQNASGGASRPER